MAIGSREEEREREKEEGGDKSTTIEQETCEAMTARSSGPLENYFSFKIIVSVDPPPLRKLIRRPLFPPSLIECRGETNDTELSFESSLLGTRVTLLFPFPPFSLLYFFLALLHPLSLSLSNLPFSKQHNQLNLLYKTKFVLRYGSVSDTSGLNYRKSLIVSILRCYI